MTVVPKNDQDQQSWDIASSARRVILVDTSGYDTLIDEGATYTYIGKALPGTLSSAATWRVFRITNATGVLRHADGVSSFTKVFDDRTGYTYG